MGYARRADPTAAASSFESLVERGAGFLGVVRRGAFGGARGAGQDAVGDGGVLDPDGGAHLAAGERRPHAALEMGPTLGDRLGDREVPGQPVDALVEGDVALDPVMDRRIGRQGLARGQALSQPVDLRRRGLSSHDALGGEAGCQPVDGGAQLIEVAHAAGLDRRHRQATPAVLDHQTLPLQQLERMAHRLA